MGGYSSRNYWHDVGRTLLQRPDDDESTIASDDTPYYRLKQSRFFEEFLDPATAGAARILEVGQGPGGNLARLAARSKLAVGVDVSPSMLELARRRGLAHLVQMDGTSLPFQDQSYDAVFTSTVLQHNRPEIAEQLLSEIARVSASAVHFFEDTAAFNVRSRESHWLRKPAWYITRMQKHGFALQYCKRLPLCCQEVAAQVARMLVDSHEDQGAPPSSARLRIEAGFQKLARPVDRLVPPALGLTRMSFARLQDTKARVAREATPPQD